MHPQKSLRNSSQKRPFRTKPQQHLASLLEPRIPPPESDAENKIGQNQVLGISDDRGLPGPDLQQFANAW